MCRLCVVNKHLGDRRHGKMGDMQHRKTAAMWGRISDSFFFFSLNKLLFFLATYTNKHIIKMHYLAGSRLVK